MVKEKGSFFSWYSGFHLIKVFCYICMYHRQWSNRKTDNINRYSNKIVWGYFYNFAQSFRTFIYILCVCSSICTLHYICFCILTLILPSDWHCYFLRTFHNMPCYNLAIERERVRYTFVFMSDYIRSLRNHFQNVSLCK